MSGLTRALCLALIWLSASLPLRARQVPEPGAKTETEPSAARPGAGGEVRQGRGGDGEWLVATLPGTVVAALVVGDEASLARTVLLLVAPPGEEDGPRSLFRLRLATGAEPLTLLRRNLPGSAKALAALKLPRAGGPLRDGEPDILLGGLGSLHTLGPLAGLATGPPPRLLLTHPGFDLRSLSAERIRDSGAGEAWIGAAEAGVLRLYRPDGAGGLARVAERLLPLTAEREPTGLELTSPHPEALPAGEGEEGVPTFAVGPQAHGRRRLRTILLTPDGGEGEAWSLLPGPERVEQSWYRLVDGRPVLFVAVQSADKIGIFETRKLRVFPLRDDRTRTGKGPLFSHDTDARRWFRMDLHVDDVDGDGRQDLVLLYPEGLGGGELAIEVFPGLGGGRFLRKARRAKLDPTPEAWSWGADLSGDGVPDLVTFGAEAVAVYPGAKQGRVVAKRPSWEIPLPSPPEGVDGDEGGSEGRDENGPPSPSLRDLTAVDLDGDGRPEVLRILPGPGGTGRVIVVRFAAPGPPPPR